MPRPRRSPSPASAAPESEAPEAHEPSLNGEPASPDEPELAPESLASPEPEPEPESEDGEIWEGPGGAFRHVMWLRGQMVFENLDHFHEDPSVEVIHDLRVSCRRLSSTLALAGELIGSKPVRRARRQLDDLRSGLGDLRDLHIQCQWLGEHVTTLPQLQPRLEALQERETQCWEQARKQVEKLKARKLGRRLEAIDALVAALIETSDGWHECLEMLRRGVATRFAAVLARKHKVDPGVGATLHNLRIAFKKFRYKAELVGQLEEPPRPAEHGLAMRAVQRALGGLQDVEVITRGLERDWIEHPPNREHQLDVMQHLVEHRRTLLKDFEKACLPMEGFWQLPEGEL